METYQEFLDRISSFETKELRLGDLPFRGNPSIAQKVGPDNAFRNFYGDTVVFALDKQPREQLAAYVDALYRAASECFCERLDPETLHVTLHDLSAAPLLRDAEAEMRGNGERIIGKLEELRRLGDGEIRLQSTCVFNMVNTSLVLGLRPADEADYRRLMDLYAVFDGIKRLPYPFTPHVTLAYYHINGFDARAAGRLAAAVERLNGGSLEIRLSPGTLYYQHFTRMNAYINVIRLGG